MEVGDSPQVHHERAGAALKHHITLEFDEFGWSRLATEAERQGVSVADVIVHAAMYYLADVDSGRVAVRILRDAEWDAEPAEDDPEQPPGRRFDRPDDAQDD